LKHFRLLFPLLLASAAFAQAPQAAAPAAQDLGGARQRLQELQMQLDQVDGQLRQLGRRRSGALVELHGIALRASKAAARAEVARLRQEEARNELQGLNRRKSEINGELGKLKESLSRQVKWLHALGPLGALSFFPSRADIENYLLRNRYLEWWRNNENKKLHAFRGLHAELAVREKEIAEAEARYSVVMAEMGELQEELAANERQLQARLEGIRRDEQQRMGMQAEIREEAIQLERMLAGIMSAPGASAPVYAAAPFSSFAGRLPRPVEGALAEGMGIQTHPVYGTKTENKGLLIAARSGAPVRAVADGQVAKAMPYLSFGLIAIIDHGGACYSIYKHLQAVSVSEGQAVKRGETIGYVGGTHDGPRLGFDINCRGKYEDPQRWLASRYVR
jgi:murein DD-endopeptidase MepM/ murein hydrolase activator NlpD